MTTSRIAFAVQQLTGVFAREPDRHLSLAEAELLTGLDRRSCQIVLETLLDARVLARAADGRFVRRVPPKGAISGPRL